MSTLHPAAARTGIPTREANCSEFSPDQDGSVTRAGSRSKSTSETWCGVRLEPHIGTGRMTRVTWLTRRYHSAVYSGRRPWKMKSMLERARIRLLPAESCMLLSCTRNVETYGSSTWLCRGRTELVALVFGLALLPLILPCRRLHLDPAVELSGAAAYA